MTRLRRVADGLGRASLPGVGVPDLLVERPKRKEEKRKEATGRATDLVQ